MRCIHELVLFISNSLQNINFNWPKFKGFNESLFIFWNRNDLKASIIKITVINKYTFSDNLSLRVTYEITFSKYFFFS